MKTKSFLKSILLTLLFSASILAQDNSVLVGSETNSTIKEVTFLIAESATISDNNGKVKIFAENLEPGISYGALITVPYARPRVKAYAVVDGSLRIESANKLSNNEDGSSTYLLDTPGKWVIEVAAIVDDEWQTDYFNDVIVKEPSEVGSNPDPPGDDDGGDTDPPSDFTRLTELTKALMIEVGPQNKLDAYVQALDAIEWTGNLQQLKTKVANARLSTFVGVVEGKWYKLFQGLDPELSQLQTAEEYTAACKAILAGLKQAQSMQVPVQVSTVNTPLTFPSNPIVGQMFNGYQYQQRCYSNGTCSFNWVKVQ